MKYLISLIVIILLFFTACGTHKKVLVASNNHDHHFNNQGEQENYWAEELFKLEYKKQRIKRYNGYIRILDENHISYGKLLLQFDTNSKFKEIFTTGIFYPGLISNCNLIISDLEEQSFLSHSIKVKRFKLLILTPYFTNPTVYFLEITNNKATDKTDLENFIKGSKLTFLKDAWIDI
jgi:hypothetical protein